MRRTRSTSCAGSFALPALTGEGNAAPVDSRFAVTGPDPYY